ncbi:hypothetical protein HDU88_009037 [Geranomyces variabilis]|nr:hypothetical protein HDU88_009037 [Geranomyces variabilis]
MSFSRGEGFLKGGGIYQFDQNNRFLICAVKFLALISTGWTPSASEILARAFDDSLELNESSQLSVVKKTLTSNAPIVIDADNRVSLQLDATLSVENGALHVVEGSASQDSVKAPIIRDADAIISLDIGKGLEVDSDGKLITNVGDAIKTLGVLTDGGLASIGLDEAVSLGFSSLGDLTNSVPDEQVTVIRLKTGDDFTQKTGALMMKNKGNNCIPYYGTAFDGLNTRDVFQFNDTLSTLSVPHITLNSNFSPQNNEAVSAAFVAQYIQGKSGGGIDVGAEVSGRRELSIRTDASLVIDGNQNLSVNPSPIVNGSSVRVVDGKIASGLIFQSSNGVQLRDGTNNDVQLSLKTQGALSMVGLDTIKESLTASDGVKRIDNNISLDLQGSQYITIEGNTISTSLKEYEAGENITIANAVISANIPEGTTYTAGPGLSMVGTEFVNNLTITAGLGIIVAGSAETGYVISAESLKTKRTDDEDESKTDNDTDQTLEATNSNPEVIESIGAIASLVPLALTPLAGLGGIASAPAAIGGGLFGLLGGLAAGAGAAGLFGTLWSYEKDRRTKKNLDGSVQTDANGNPVYDLDPNGNYQFDPADATGIAIVQDKTTRKSKLLFDSIQLPTYGEQAMNYAMSWDFENNITRPWAVDTVNHRSYASTTYATIATVSSNTSRISTAESNITLLQSSKQSLISVSSGLTLTGSTLGYDNTILAQKLTLDSAVTRLTTAEGNITGLQTSKQDAISVSTGLTLTGTTLGYDNTVIAQKSNLDSALARIGTAETNITALQSAKQNILSFSSPLALSGTTVSIDTSQITSLETLGSLVVNGNVSAAEPTSSTHLATKNYVDSKQSGAITAGAGLTLNTNIMSLNPSQTLSSLTVTGTTDSSSSTTGALQVAGGAAIGKGLNVGGNAVDGNITLQSAANDSGTNSIVFSHVVPNATLYRKTAIMTQATGTQWGRSNLNLCVNTAADTTNATLADSRLTISGTSGVVTINGTTDSTSSTTGALQIAGGVGIAKTLFVNGTIYANIVGAGPIVPLNLNSPTLSTGSFSCLQMGVNAATNQMARMYFNYVGSGSASNSVGLGLWGSPSIQVDGIGNLTVNSTVDYFSTSSTSALYVAGGIRTSKSIFLNLSANIATAPSYIASNVLDGAVLRTYADPNNLVGDGTWNRYLDIAALGASNGSVGGGCIRFLTNPNASTTAVERMRISNDGTVKVAGAILPQHPNIVIVLQQASQTCPANVINPAYGDNYNQVAVYLKGINNSNGYQLQTHYFQLQNFNSNYTLNSTFIANVVAGGTISLAVYPKYDIVSVGVNVTSATYGSNFLSAEWIGP